MKCDMPRTTLRLALVVCIQATDPLSGYAITEKDAVRQAMDECSVSFSSDQTSAKLDCVMKKWLNIDPNTMYEAARQGRVGVQFWLGRAYERGDLGVPQDYTESMLWYFMAADQGLSAAQKEMGDFFYLGNGVTQNYRDALAWYQLAAEQGEGFSQGILGLMYELGQGVPQDFVKAHMWYNLAAANVDASLRENQELAADARDALAFKMTASQVADAQKLAREWKPKNVKSSLPRQWFDEALR